MTDGWLDWAIRVPTKRTTALDVPHPLGLTSHWTGGGDPAALARRIRALPPPPGATPAERERASKTGIEPAASSWHLLVAKSGDVIQSAPFTVGTWHVGRSGRVGGRIRVVNKCTIGMELDNLGEVHADGDEWTNGKYRTQVAPVEIAGRFFDPFTEAQELACVRIVRDLVEAYGFKRRDLSYGHSEFDPGRKHDPGPLWRGTVLPRVLNEAGVTA